MHRALLHAYICIKLTITLRKLTVEAETKTEKKDQQGMIKTHKTLALCSAHINQTTCKKGGKRSKRVCGIHLLFGLTECTVLAGQQRRFMLTRNWWKLAALDFFSSFCMPALYLFHCFR